MDFYFLNSLIYWIINYFFLIKIIFSVNFNSYKFKLNIVFLNFFRYNFLFYFLCLYLIKKNNSLLKSYWNLNYVATKLKNIKNSILFSNFFFLKKYFFYFQKLNENRNINYLKFFDLKKKFIKNLIQFKKKFIIFLLFKKKKKKTNLKNYNYFHNFFKYNFFLFEYLFINIILKLKYILNYSDYFFLIKNNFLYINRKKALFKSIFLINKFDLIEFVFNKIYIFYLKKIYLLYFLKYKYKIYSYWYSFDNFNKSWFFENCYKTGTIILFWEKSNFFLISNYKSFFINYYLLKLYYWK